MKTDTKFFQILDWILRLTAAAILAQTLWFKFSAAPEPVYIFAKVGLGALGRIGTGVAELIAVILLLVTSTVWLGATISLGIMAGAITCHLTVLGIDVLGDHGELFILALIVASCSLVLLFFHRREIQVLGHKINFYSPPKGNHFFDLGD
jgi:putative oxidoreductase